MFQNQFIDTFSRCKGFFGYLGRIFITDNRIKSRNHTDAIVYISAAYFLISGNTVDTERAQGIESVHQQIGRLKTTLRHYGFHCIQLHLSCFATHSHTKVVADYLIGYLIHYLRDNRVDLTRHNGRPRLHGGKIDFSQSATRTGCKQTKVIAYLVHLHRNSSHSRGVAYKARSIRSSSH